MDVADSPLYDISVVEQILPHRSPFLFVDRVTEFEVHDRIVAEKTLLPDDHFFDGHFPGNPIMPGVLVSEALAQTSGLLLGLTWKEQGHSLNKERANVLVLASVNMKFSSPARPGETLRLEAGLKKHYGKMFLFDVAACVANNPIAKGTLTLAQEK